MGTENPKSEKEDTALKNEKQLIGQTPKTQEKKDLGAVDRVWDGVTKAFQENPDYEVPY